MKISFARDRVVEVYFFVLAMYFEPQYSRARRILTKVLYIISTIDDMYDAYGSLEEHKLFAEMIERFSNMQIIHLDFVHNFEILVFKLNQDLVLFDSQVGYQQHRSTSRIHESNISGTLRCLQRN